MLRMVCFSVAMCFLMAGSTAATALDPAKASFLKDILPLLEDHCYACHGDGQTKGLALDGFKRKKMSITATRFGSRFASLSLLGKCHQKAGRIAPMVRSAIC